MMERRETIRHVSGSRSVPREEKEEAFVEYDSSDDADNRSYIACSYMAYLRPLPRYRV